ncbi:hypothetical protein SASPL_150406 [Salvia splendens]|uniref:Uncharacterized protein n=1 Tax=Salvia splendens TaxID=180675 RepID=A0A8X8W6T5_SALSN|nr:hypothetical protein SASPL_150406 [Salvia splendens]
MGRSVSILDTDLSQLSYADERLEHHFDQHLVKREQEGKDNMGRSVDILDTDLSQLSYADERLEHHFDQHLVKHEQELNISTNREKEGVTFRIQHHAREMKRNQPPQELLQGTKGVDNEADTVLKMQGKKRNCPILDMPEILWHAKLTSTQGDPFLFLYSSVSLLVSVLSLLQQFCEVLGARSNSYDVNQERSPNLLTPE